MYFRFECVLAGRLVIYDNLKFLREVAVGTDRQNSDTKKGVSYGEN